jgi:hemerythrin-like domain-containing protein
MLFKVFKKNLREGGMKPIGPLMREHRRIERIIPVLKTELNRIDKGNEANVELLTVTVDFFRTYADRTHHGKEEDILFRELVKKPLSPEHKTTMDELIQEHIYARKTVSALVAAKDAYRKGDKRAVRDIVKRVTELVNFYPAHIEKEDQHFFYPVLDYFSKQEQDDMLQEFWEFDRKMIHEKYQKVVEELRKS